MEDTGAARAPPAQERPPVPDSFVVRFLAFALLVTVLSLVGTIVAKYLAAYGPQGLQDVVGAGS